MPGEKIVQVVRRVSREGLELIKRFEGFSPKPYADAAGVMTIGYGHVIRPGEAFQMIGEAEAERLLRADMLHAERAVAKYIVPLSHSCRFDALVSFTFNLGTGALQCSTLRQKVNRGEHEDAAAEFSRWVWAGGRKWAGLVRRRQAESWLYSKGLYAALL